MTPATLDRLTRLGLPECSRVAVFALNLEVPHPDVGELLVRADGSLNPNRAPLEGVTLEEAEVLAFLEATAEREHPAARARCFFPRHAVGFYDAAGGLLAHYTVCFSCRGFRAGRPGGGARLKFVREPDYAALAALFAQRGLARV